MMMKTAAIPVQRAANLLKRHRIALPRFSRLQKPVSAMYLNFLIKKMLAQSTLHDDDYALMDDAACGKVSKPGD